jgi:hypothetical protein
MIRCPAVAHSVLRVVSVGGVFSGIELETDVRFERGPILHRRCREVERCVTQGSSSLKLSSASGNTFDADASPDGVEHSSARELFG